MINLAIKLKSAPCLKHVFIDEGTLSVDHYDKGVTSEQLDQTMALLQKTIDSIYDMTFSTFRDNTFKRITGENDLCCIKCFTNDDHEDDEYKFVNVFINDENCLITLYGISYYDLKKLLMAQNKENELSYLLLKGVIE